MSTTEIEDRGDDRLRSASRAVYGSMVLLPVLEALAREVPPPTAGQVVAALVSTAFVLWIAHIFSTMVPIVALSGRVRGTDLLTCMRRESALLFSLVLPLVPILLYRLGVIEGVAAFRLAIAFGLGALFAFSVRLGRVSGLSWPRAAGAGVVLVIVGAIVLVLETALFH